MTLEQQLKSVIKNGLFVQHIKEPSIEVQLAAVVVDGGQLLKYIEEPSVEVQLATVKRESCSIMHIKNQTIEAIDMALSRDPDNKRFINTELLTINQNNYLKLKYGIGC